jgi:hypothetical protein
VTGREATLPVSLLPNLTLTGMENLFDLLVPIIFILTFVLNGLFNKGKKGKGAPGDEGVDEPEDALPADPLAELREEIRRRIEANQRGADAPGAPAPAAPSPVSRPVQVYREATRVAPAPSQADAETAERMRQMQRMQERVKDLQQQAQEEKRKAASLTGSNPWDRKGSSTRSHSRFRNRGLVAELVSELKDAGSSRKAVLSAEILGTPVGLRKPSQGHGLWGS